MMVSAFAVCGADDHSSLSVLPIGHTNTDNGSSMSGAFIPAGINSDATALFRPIQSQKAARRLPYRRLC